MFVKEVAIKTKIGTTVIYDEHIEAHTFKDGVRIIREYCYPANGKYRHHKREEQIIRDYKAASKLVSKITLGSLYSQPNDFKRTVLCTARRTTA